MNEPRPDRVGSPCWFRLDEIGDSEELTDYEWLRGTLRCWHAKTATVEAEDGAVFAVDYSMLLMKNPAGEAENEAAKRRVEFSESMLLDFVEKIGETPMSKISKRFYRFGIGKVERALASLVESSRLEMSVVQGAGRPKTVFTRRKP